MKTTVSVMAAIVPFIVQVVVDVADCASTTAEVMSDPQQAHPCEAVLPVAPLIVMTTEQVVPAEAVTNDPPCGPPESVVGVPFVVLHPEKLPSVNTVPVVIWVGPNVLRLAPFPILTLAFVLPVPILTALLELAFRLTVDPVT